MITIDVFSKCWLRIILRLCCYLMKTYVYGCSHVCMLIMSLFLLRLMIVAECMTTFGNQKLNRVRFRASKFIITEWYHFWLTIKFSWVSLLSVLHLHVYIRRRQFSFLLCTIVWLKKLTLFFNNKIFVQPFWALKKYFLHLWTFKPYRKQLTASP